MGLRLGVGDSLTHPSWWDRNGGKRAPHFPFLIPIHFPIPRTKRGKSFKPPFISLSYFISKRHLGASLALRWIKDGMGNGIHHHHPCQALLGPQAEQLPAARSIPAFQIGHGGLFCKQTLSARHREIKEGYPPSLGLFIIWLVISKVLVVWFVRSSFSTCASRLNNNSPCGELVIIA